MSGSTFRALLTQTAETVERPRPLVEGHYIATIKHHEFGTSSKKKTPFLRIFCVPLQETDDVPEGANDGIDFSKKELRADYYITGSALYRLSDMLDAVLGLQPGRPFDERIPELRSQTVLIKVTQRSTDSDPPEIYNDVTSMVAAPTPVVELADVAD